MVRLTYELSHEFMADEEGNPIADKPRWIHEQVPVYGLDADRAKLTQRFSGFDTSNETDGVLYDCLGNACTVVIAHGKRDGQPDNPYINVAAVTPPQDVPGYVQPELVNPSFYFDPLDNELCTVEGFRALPEFVQKMIIEADDYKSSYLATLLSGEGDDGRDQQPEQQSGESTGGEPEPSEDNPY
jgi:hypothetical protein